MSEIDWNKTNDRMKLNAIIRAILAYRNCQFDKTDDYDNAIYCIDEIERIVSS